MVTALRVYHMVQCKAVTQESQVAGGTEAILLSDLVNLLVLIKSTLKACCLPHENHVRMVKHMLLTPFGPGPMKLNCLQVTLLTCRWSRSYCSMCLSDTTVQWHAFVAQMSLDVWSVYTVRQKCDSSL